MQDIKIYGSLIVDFVFCNGYGTGTKQLLVSLGSSVEKPYPSEGKAIKFVRGSSFNRYLVMSEFECFWPDRR